MLSLATVVIAACLAAAVPAQGKLPELIRLQLRGVDGKLVREEPIALIFEAGDKRHCQLPETDSRGVLEITAPAAMRAARRGTLLLHRGSWPKDDEVSPMNPRHRYAPERTPLRYVGAKQLEFSSLQQPGIQPVQLEAPKLVFAGRVVDRQGVPVAGVRVAIGDHGGLPTNWREIQVREMHEFAVRADRSGRFTIHELATTRDRIKLRVEVDGFAMVGCDDASVGNTDARITIGRVSQVFAEIKDVPPRAAMPLTASMVPHKPLAKRNTFDTHFIRDGRIRLQDCFAGTYDFVLRPGFGGDAKPIVTIENVKVEAGKDCRDPRLAAIDISDRFRWIKVDFAASNSDTFEQVQLEIDAAPLSSTTNYGGHTTTTILIPKTGATLTARAKGFRSKAMKNVKEDVKIVLEPASKIAIRIRNLPALQSAAIELRPLRDSDRDKPRFMRRSPVDSLDSAEDTVTIPVERAAPLRFELVAIVAGEDPRPGLRGPAKEFIKLGHRRFVVSDEHLNQTRIPWDLQLTPVELAVVRSFEAVLKERNR